MMVLVLLSTLSIALLFVEDANGATMTELTVDYTIAIRPYPATGVNRLYLADEQLYLLYTCINIILLYLI